MRKENTGQRISEEVLCAEYEAVYRYVLSLCRNDMEAQDITQETFLKAMKAYGTFKGDSSLYTWLCAIAKNLWLNNCKTYSREVLPEEMYHVQNGSQEPVEQGLMEKESALQIHRVLHHMQERNNKRLRKRTFGALCRLSKRIRNNLCGYSDRSRSGVYKKKIFRYDENIEKKKALCLGCGRGFDLRHSDRRLFSAVTNPSGKYTGRRDYGSVCIQI